MTTRRLSQLMLLFCLCPLAGAGDFDWPATVDWQPAFVGVERMSVTLTEPRPLCLHAFRVDRSAEGIRLATNNSNGPRPLEIDGCFTTTFLKQKGCQLAINGAPFGPGRAAEGETQDVSGLVISRGELVSPIEVPGEPDRAALVLRDDRLAIEHPPIDTEGVQLAVGGFGVVLTDSKLVHDLTTPDAVLNNAHPRTAVGLGEEGRILYLVVVDGRQPGYSEGVTLRELGGLFRLLGADDALNLDGGGTTSMAIASEDGEPVLVNQPINAKTVGKQRVAASHLGVFAKRLEAAIDSSR